MRLRSWCAVWGVASALVALSSPAAAQWGTVSWAGAGTTPTCDMLATGLSCDPSRTGECASPAQCTGVASGLGFCTPPQPLFCALEPWMCPEARPVRFSVGAFDLCLPINADLCGIESPADLVPCFTRPPRDMTRPVFPVDWAMGDCDLDGLSNARDDEPCMRPRPLAVVTTAGGCELAPGCVDDVDCAATERCTDPGGGELGRYCDPEARHYHCCGGGFAAYACAGDALCHVSTAVADDFGFCEDPVYCEAMGFADRVSCIMVDGVAVNPDDGDCDLDGVSNRDEVDLGTDPCVDERPDAGVPPGPDAGPSVDAGGAMDGSVPPAQVPTFAGGGGCRCRAAPSRSGEGGPAFALGLFALLAARRRQGS